VEDLVVEVVALRECREVLACLRGMVVVQFDDDDALSPVSPGCLSMATEVLTVVVSSAISVAMMFERL
jgi:hypothetical protein